MKRGAFVHGLVILVAASLVLGCTTPPASVVPATAVQTPVATPDASSPRTTPGAMLSASPAATAEPTGTLVATPAPTEPLIIDWTRRGADGLDGLGEIRGSASDGTTNVLVGTLAQTDGDTDISAIWASTDGRHWDRVLEPPVGQRLLAVTAGGPGFVAVGHDDGGAVAWTSEDGGRWRQRFDDGFDRGAMQMIVATRSGLVAFGRRMDTDSRVIWTSPDGIEWLTANNPSGLQVARGVMAVAAKDGRALAFVGVGDYELGPVEVWETTGRAEWRSVGPLPGGTALVMRAAAGPHGWVTLGFLGDFSHPAAWYSADGQTWESAPTGPDVSAAVIGVDAGFVATGAVGSLRDDTCGDQRHYHGHTWTTGDGISWQRMAPTADFEWASIAALFDVAPNLVGIGASYPGEHFSTLVEPARWTAPLPSTPGESASDAPPPSQPCGG